MPATKMRRETTALYYANKFLPEGGFTTLGRFKWPFDYAAALAEAKKLWPETDAVAWDQPKAKH